MLVTDLADHHCAVNAVAFSPDGTRVATATGNLRGGKARVFEVASDALIQRATDLMIRSLNPAEPRRYLLRPDCLHVKEWSLRHDSGAVQGV